LDLTINQIDKGAFKPKEDEMRLVSGLAPRHPGPPSRQMRPDKMELQIC
jgi:hypothetical protein